MIALSAAVLAIAGALLLYLASPNQQMLRRPPARRMLALAGGAAMIAALVLLLIVAGRATAVFIWLTAAMLVWTVAPIAAAYWRRPKGDAQ